MSQVLGGSLCCCDKARPLCLFNAGVSISRFVHNYSLSVVTGTPTVKSFAAPHRACRWLRRPIPLANSNCPQAAGPKFVQRPCIPNAPAPCCTILKELFFCFPVPCRATLFAPARQTIGNSCHPFAPPDIIRKGWCAGVVFCRPLLGI